MRAINDKLAHERIAAVTAELEAARAEIARLEARIAELTYRVDQLLEQIIRRIDERDALDERVRVLTAEVIDLRARHREGHPRPYDGKTFCDWDDCEEFWPCPESVRLDAILAAAAPAQEDSDDE